VLGAIPTANNASRGSFSIPCRASRAVDRRTRLALRVFWAFLHACAASHNPSAARYTPASAGGGGGGGGLTPYLLRTFLPSYAAISCLYRCLAHDLPIAATCAPASCVYCLACLPSCRTLLAISTCWRYVASIAPAWKVTGRISRRVRAGFGLTGASGGRRASSSCRDAAPQHISAFPLPAACRLIL